jgi:DNA replication protein DnaC
MQQQTNSQPESIGDILSNILGSIKIISDEQVEQIKKDKIKQERQAMYDRSGLYSEYKKFRPQMSDSQEWTFLYEKIKRQANEKHIYVFIGNRGAGKSIMGGCLVGHWCFNLGKPAFYSSAVDMLNIFKMATNGFLSDYDHAIFKFLRSDLLIIDCIENKWNDERANIIFDELIDKRSHSSVSTTILISNQTEESFYEIVGKSAESRIKAYGGIIGNEIFGQSRRNRK